jgi:nitroimidazol reductase NimA-like FMN-containing flavoprotein (pyridoxamine 5'-phosphate oxidase superfamily)
MMNEYDAYLDQPILARMATANPKTLQPHVVPVWYAWDGTSLWINSFRSTRKVKDLLKNPAISVVVDTSSPVDGISAVILEGQAEIMELPRDELEEKITWIYTRYLGTEGVKEAEPQSWIKDPEAVVIRLTPDWVKSWK